MSRMGQLHENVAATARFPQHDDALEARHDRCDRWLTAVMDAATSNDAPAIERIANEVFTVSNRAAEDVFAVADAVRKGEPYARALDTLARRLDKLAYEVPDYE